MKVGIWFFVCSTASAAQFPNPLTLPSAPGVESVQIGGPGSINPAQVAAPIGDINGDGRPDFALGAPDASPAGSGSGVCYVLFGGGHWAQLSTLDVATLNGTNGFAITGVAASDGLGSSIAGAGDMNGDGYDDLIVSVPGLNDAAGDPRGGAYVVLGGPNVGASGTIPAAAIVPPVGFQIRYPGPNYWHSPALAGIKDVDADGYDDVLLGDVYESVDVPTYPLLNDSAPRLAAGDLDGDGDADLVVTDDIHQQYRVYLNGGGGQFTATAYPFTGYPSKVLLADVDQDGDLDIVVRGVATSGVARISVIHNLNGVFGSPTHILSLDDHLDFDVGDVDGDGFPDIVSCVYDQGGFSGTPNKLAVFRNDQSGGFIALPALNTPIDPILVRAGDIDGDGDADVAVYCQGPNTMKFFENDGLGGLTPVGGGAGTSLPPGGLGIDFRMADLDGDGDLELVAQAYGGVLVHLNQSQFVFAPQVYYPSQVNTSRLAIGDFDGDGDLDVVTSTSNSNYPKQIVLYLNAGDGTLQQNRSFAEPIIAGGEVVDADFDLDGDIDCALIANVTSHEREVLIALNTGEGAFPGPSMGQAHVIRGRSNLGAVATVDLGQLQPSEGFVMRGRYAYEYFGSSVAGCGDLNGDGIPDFVVGASGAFSNSGTGTARVIFGAPGLASGGSLDAHALNGSNGFDVADTADTGYIGGALGQPGDFDGDGRDDLFLGERDAFYPLGVRHGSAYVVFGSVALGASGHVSLLAPDGVASLQIIGAQTYDQVAYRNVGCGDINGDGRDDVIMGDSSYDEQANNRGAAFITYGAPRPYPTGVLDLASLNGVNGFRILGENAEARLGDVAWSVGDLDADGIDDMLIPEPGWNYYHGHVFVVLGQRYGIPTTYCTSKTNSLGCLPSIGWSGNLPSVTDSDTFLVTASNTINQRNGLLFYGVAGRGTFPFLGGTLCVQTPLRRTPIQSSGGNSSPDDCSGAFGFNWKAWMLSGADPSLVAGVTVDAQYWSRDPQSSFSVNLTNAIEFTIEP